MIHIKVMVLQGQKKNKYTVWSKNRLIFDLILFDLVLSLFSPLSSGTTFDIDILVT